MPAPRRSTSRKAQEGIDARENRWREEASLTYAELVDEYVEKHLYATDLRPAQQMKCARRCTDQKSMASATTSHQEQPK
jgi:hypothetical protein